MIFNADEAKILFLSIIKKAKKKYVFHIENICVMGNHFHLIIRPGWGESLSAIMQWILGVFAMRFNRYNHVTGHVWGERFSSKIIESLRAYLKILSYIDANPLSAGLVTRAEDWLYGRFHLRDIGFAEILASPSSLVGWP